MCNIDDGGGCRDEMCNIFDSLSCTRATACTTCRGAAITLRLQACGDRALLLLASMMMMCMLMMMMMMMMMMMTMMMMMMMMMVVVVVMMRMRVEFIFVCRYVYEGMLLQQEALDPEFKDDAWMMDRWWLLLLLWWWWWWWWWW